VDLALLVSFLAAVLLIQLTPGPGKAAGTIHAGLAAWTLRRVAAEAR
jgi:hypothetical protein